MTAAEPSAPNASRLAFVGGGNMARSLIGGLIARGMPAACIAVAEPLAAAREALQRDFGVRITADSASAAQGADGVVLAVKPQVMREACAALAPALAPEALVISVAAGITTGQLERWLGGSRRVVRAMPNTPALLGAGATGLFANARCRTSDRQLADSVLGAVGLTAWIADEALMDSVTALSGSGPAYLFLLAEAMVDAAIGQGLPADTARALTRQTLLGAARMLAEGDDDAPTLRARVTSPGGTTQAAIETFEAGGLRELVQGALAAAQRRGVELAQSAGG
jgi:pyrroline-5-carboxylate reductase